MFIFKCGRQKKAAASNITYIFSSSIAVALKTLKYFEKKNLYSQGVLSTLEKPQNFILEQNKMLPLGIYTHSFYIYLHLYWSTLNIQ